MEQNSYSNIFYEGKYMLLYEWFLFINLVQSGSFNYVDFVYFFGFFILLFFDNDEGSGGVINYISGNKIGWEKMGSYLEFQV